MSEEEPKKKSTRARKASPASIATAVDTAVRLTSVGPKVTPPRLVAPKLTRSTTALLASVAEKVITEGANGGYEVTDREATRKALEALGGKRWAAERMFELEEALVDLNSMDPSSRQGFVI